MVIEAGGIPMIRSVKIWNWSSKSTVSCGKTKKTIKSLHVPDPVCWTQVPEDIRSLKSQRIRWHKGLMDSLLNHLKMLFNPKYGTVGLLAMPYYFFVEMLGAVIESFRLYFLYPVLLAWHYQL
ncbi:MAG: glycosyltransferase [Alkalibacterium sp.]|nr:glycosyltransferase [Alkalibacterium sp.]